MAAKVNKKDILKRAAITGVFVASLALITTAIIMLSNHQNEILARAEVEATNKTETCFDEVIKGIKTYELTCQNFSGKIEQSSDELVAMNLISKVYPINAEKNEKKVFYFFIRSPEKAFSLKKSVLSGRE